MRAEATRPPSEEFVSYTRGLPGKHDAREEGAQGAVTRGAFMSEVNPSGVTGRPGGESAAGSGTDRFLEEANVRQASG